MAARSAVLYSKPGCHLCEEALVLLEQTGRSLSLALRIRQIDITTDPELEERYGGIIPVITLDNGLTLTAPIRPGPLREALQATAR